MDQPTISTVLEEQPPVLPGQQVSTPPPAPLPAEPLPTPAKKRLPLVPILVAVIFVAAALILYLRLSQQQSAPPVAQISPTPIPNPTQPSRLSLVATTSAFISFDSALASLSASINAFTLSDGTLAPPTLDIELGLTP